MTSARPIHRGELWSLLALMALVALLWDSRWVYPLRILVVFFHELSHGLAALATGGSIEAIQVVAEEGGSCLTAGGSPFIILSAGYLGSLAWGGAILVLATRTRFDRAVAGVLGAILVLSSLLFVRPFLQFGFIFGAASGLGMVAAAAYLSPAANDFVLKLVGLTSCLYAVLDIKSDILEQPGAVSDARLLADHTGVPALLWGLLWIALALAASAGFLALASRKRTAAGSAPAARFPA